MVSQDNSPAIVPQIVEEDGKNGITSKSIDISFDIVPEQEVNGEVTK